MKQTSTLQDLAKKKGLAAESSTKEKARKHEQVRNQVQSQVLLKKQQAETQKLENQLKTNLIKRGKQISEFKIQRFRQERQEKAKQEYQEKIVQNEELKRQKQAEIQELENLELELVQKLHQTQMVQKNALEQLNCVLNMEVDEFERRFGSKKKKIKKRSQRVDTLHNQTELHDTGPENEMDSCRSKTINGSRSQYITLEPRARPSNHRIQSNQLLRASKQKYLSQHTLEPISHDLTLPKIRKRKTRVKLKKYMDKL